MGSVDPRTPMGHEMREHFLFDPKYKNLNHGSWGTYPQQVREDLHRHQALAEARPDKFLRYTYPDLLDASRAALARLLNVPLEETVVVQNATSAINLVLRNLVYKEGDTLIYFDTIYGACEKTVASLMETTPQLVVRKVNYELPCSFDEVVSNFLDVVKQAKSEGLNPKIAIFDTIAALPGVRFPFERLTAECRKAGIMSLIDGAHGVGHLPLDLAELDADFFVSNCHKWLYTPRGCAVFHVPERNHHLIRTTYPTSHGFVPVLSPDPSHPIRNPLPPVGKSSFVSLFQFVATTDNSPYYTVPCALSFRDLVCGGEAAIHSYIKHNAQEGADTLARMFGTEVMDDGVDWRGSAPGLRNCALATVRLPVAVPTAEAGQARLWVEKTLADEYETFLAVFEYKGRMWTRLSGQVYLDRSDWEWAGGVLRELCARVAQGAHLGVSGKEADEGGDDVAVLGKAVRDVKV